MVTKKPISDAQYAITLAQVFLISNFRPATDICSGLLEAGVDSVGEITVLDGFCKYFCCSFSERIIGVVAEFSQLNALIFKQSGK